MLPPGRARFETTPVLTASPMAPITIGMVLVARFAASAAGVPQVTITSTGMALNSAAMTEYRSS
jgi:hypothetical protein